MSGHEYSFDLSIFPQNDANLEIIEKEIKKSTFPHDPISSSKNSHTVSITFNVELTDQEEIDLQNLVATHVPPARPRGVNSRRILESFYLERIIDPSRTFRGSIIHTGNMSFTAHDIEYLIGTDVFRIENDTITLDPADSENDRIDIIYANQLSNLGKLTGTPSSNPQKPDTSINQVILSEIYIPAGSTEPRVTYELVYDENSGPTEEWTASVTSDNLNLEGNENISGTKAITLTGAENQNKISFKRNSSIAVSTYDAVEIAIKINSEMSELLDFVFCAKYLGKKVTRGIIIRESYGFNKNITGTYQRIAIPLLISSFTDTKYDEFEIMVSGEGTVNGSIDLIRLQSGITLSADFAVTAQDVNYAATVPRYITYAFATDGRNYIRRSGGSDWKVLAPIYYPGTLETGPATEIRIVWRLEGGSADSDEDADGGEYIKYRVIDVDNDDTIVHESNALQLIDRDTSILKPLANLSQEPANWDLEWIETKSDGTPKSHSRRINLFNIVIKF